MKELILLLCGVLIGRELTAQTFSEWFRQNHTQLKYLVTQIAALKGYDLILNDGYNISREGLDSIGSIRSDDLDMHSEHFATQDNPDDDIIEDPAVATIRQYCVLLLILADQLDKVCRRLPDSPFDWPHIGPSIAGNIRELTENCTRWLDNIISANRLRMDDAGRLTQLSAMRQELRDIYGKASFLLAQLNTSTLNPWL